MVYLLSKYFKPTKVTMARKSKAQAQTLSGSPQPNFTNFAPKTIQANRAPTTADTGYEIGQQWADMTNNIIYGLASVAAGAAQWNLLGPGSSDVDTLTGDSGGAIAPVGGNITLAGGTNLTSAGAGSTITFDLDAAIVLATSVSSPIYKVAAATDLNINASAGKDIIMKMGDAAGANKVSFVDSAAVEVFSINSDGGIGSLTGLTVVGAFTQTAGAVSISQDNSANAVGIGNGNTARAVSIANSAAAHVVSIGSTTGAASLALAAGTGNFTLTGGTTTTITIGAGLTTGAITIGNTGNTGTLTLSNCTGTQQVDLANANGTKTINIGAGVDGNQIAIGNGINTTSQTISVGNGASGANSIVNILSGIGTAGAGTLALGNNTRVTTIGLGNIAPAAARTITVCGGNGAQNDTFTLMGGNPSANAQTVNILSGVPSGGTQVLNLLTQTGQAGTVNVGTGAAMANTIAIGGTGANVVTIANTQTAGSVSIGDAMTGGTIAIGGSGAQTGTITISASTAAQTLAIANGNGAKTIGIGNGISGNVITIGNGINTSAQTLTIAGGAAGASSTVNILSGNATAGTQTLNLGTGTGGKVVHIADSAGANTVTIGSTTTTSALTLQAGSGKITVTGTVKEVDADFLVRNGDSITFQQSPTTCTAATTGGVATGATGDLNLLCFQEGIIMEQFIMGAGQTIIKPVMTASGLSVALDQTNTEGAEYNFGAARTNSRNAFTIGTSAAFFFQVSMTLEDVSAGSPFLIGFRKSEANNGTFANYTDYASLGINTGTSATNVVLVTELNAGGQTITNTTDSWGGDGATATLKVLVSAAGVVTYTINGLAPTVTAAFTFDNTDVVCPFIHLLQGADLSLVYLNSMKVGFQ